MKTYILSSISTKGNGKLLPGVLLCLVAMLILFVIGCATVGRDFSVVRVSDIQIKETTQDEIRSIFGPPWRVGIEDGLKTWTYGRYRYKLFGEATTKDLVVRFDKNGIVDSYTFNMTENQ